MAELIEKTRKVSVRKPRSQNTIERWCVICGNTKDEELGFYYRNPAGEFVRVPKELGGGICRGLSTCANHVSTFGLASGEG